GGQPYVVSNNSGTITNNTGEVVNFTFTPDDDAIYTVTLTVVDGDSGSAVQTVSNIQVADVAPTVLIESISSTIDENTTASLTFRLVDPGAGDLAATGQVTVNWGNGNQIINSGTLLAELQS